MTNSFVKITLILPLLCSGLKEEIIAPDELSRFNLQSAQALAGCHSLGIPHCVVIAIAMLTKHRQR